MKLRTKVISGIAATMMAISTLATAAFAEDMIFSGEDGPNYEETVYLPEDTEDIALMDADPAEEIGMQDTDIMCLTAVPPERHIPSGNAKFYKRDGEYYIYSPDLGGEMTVKEYAMIIKEICDSFGVEVAIEFAEMIDDNPHDEEILRVFGPWEILDHWERRIDEKTNRWEI